MEVPVELRGAGHASRQVDNFGSPEGPAADRLIAVKVLTRAGNWSSYPPHRHDEEIPAEETALEEIYYFEVADGGLAISAANTSGPDREIDVLAEVRGDVVLEPSRHGRRDGRRRDRRRDDRGA